VSHLAFTVARVASLHGVCTLADPGSSWSGPWLLKMNAFQLVCSNKKLTSITCDSWSTQEDYVVVLIAIRHVSWTENITGMLLQPALCPKLFCGSLQHSIRFPPRFGGQFTAEGGNGKGRFWKVEKDRGGERREGMKLQVGREIVAPPHKIQDVLLYACTFTFIAGVLRVYIDNRSAIRTHQIVRFRLCVSELDLTNIYFASLKCYVDICLPITVLFTPHF